MAGEQFFTATGQIMAGNETIEATARGATKARAQFRLLKRLCNKIRSKLDTEGFRDDLEGGWY